MNNKNLDRMKHHLRQRVEEWLGNDIPEAGTEDYDRWHSMTEEIKDIHSIDDIVSYLESENINVDGFFIEGEYHLISAGLDPRKVSSRVVESLGSIIEINSKTSSKLYEYDGMVFLIEKNTISCQGRIEDADGLQKSTSFDESSCVSSKADAELSPKPSSSAEVKSANREPINVLIVVSEWPGGTMSHRFGHAIREALRASKEDVNVIQIFPERILKAKTSVNKNEFFFYLEKKGLSNVSKIEFVEIT